LYFVLPLDIVKSNESPCSSQCEKTCVNCPSFPRASPFHSTLGRINTMANRERSLHLCLASYSVSKRNTYRKVNYNSWKQKPKSYDLLIRPNDAVTVIVTCVNNGKLRNLSTQCIRESRTTPTIRRYDSPKDL
jgi:hypothetical protein